ncbi:MAG: hypothetical protein NVSMB29_12410 [Candidatus Dormibacteria bacterium]
MIAPDLYGPVQLSLETHFGSRHVWWDGAQWQVIPDDSKAAASQFQRFVRAARAQDGVTRVRVAGALYQLGSAEARRGRQAQARRAFDEILTRFGADRDRALKGYVAAAMVAKGDLLSRQASTARAKEAERTLRLALIEYKAVVGRYARDRDPGMHVWSAAALVASASIYAGDVFSNLAMAVVESDAAMRRVGAHTWPVAQRLTASAALTGGRCRVRLGLTGDAVAATEQALASMGDVSDPQARDFVAALQANLSVWSGGHQPTGSTEGSQPATTMLTADAYEAVQLSLDTRLSEGHSWWDGSQWQILPDRDKAAVKALQRAVASAEQSAAPSKDLVIAGALYQLGKAQVRLGRESQAVATYDEVTRRFSAETDLGLQGYVAAAHFGKAAAHIANANKAGSNKRGRLLRQALAEYRVIIARFASDPNPGMRLWAAMALVNLGDGLSGDPIDDKACAIVFYDAAARLLKLHTAVLARRVRAAALLNSGVERANLGLVADAVAVTQEVVRACQFDLDVGISGIVSKARGNIERWERPPQPSSPVAATKTKNNAAGRAFAAVFAAVFSVLAVAWVVVMATNNSNTPLSTPQSKILIPGSTSAGNPVVNPGGIVPAPTANQPVAKCVASNNGNDGVWDYHHMVDATSTAPCWAHETISLGPGCSFYIDTKGPYSSGPANIWNIIRWGYGVGSLAHGYMFQTYDRHVLIYTCVANAAVYPQTALNSVSWR